MTRQRDDFTTVVRLFADYAESPMWLAIGVVTYEEARLNADLEKDMRAWEASFYTDLDTFAGWKSPALGEAFIATGLDLAKRLAFELGDYFEVEVDTHPESRGSRRFRGESYVGNPVAAAAFHEHAARSY